MLELLLLSILHDGSRGSILFERYALLVPPDGFRLFDKSRYHAGESTSLLRKFLGRFVILIGAQVESPLTNL